MDTKGKYTYGSLRSAPPKHTHYNGSVTDTEASLGGGWGVGGSVRSHANREHRRKDLPQVESGW